MRQGKNSAYQIGYIGPCPPVGHGVHHYHFKIYALDTELDHPKVQERGPLEAMNGHIIEQAEIVGLYKRT